MHEYSCDSDRRDFVYLVSLTLCAIAAFSIVYLLDFIFGGISIVLDFLIFLVSFGPISFWVLFTGCFSGLLLKSSAVIDCSGTYNGVLKTNYDGFEKSRPITMTIHHTFRKIEIALKSETSESVSKTASLHIDGKKVEIVYTYENTGSVEQGLNRHIGTGIIEIENNTLKGQYYNHPDRKSYGTIEASK